MFIQRQDEPALENNDNIIYFTTDNNNNNNNNNNINLLNFKQQIKGQTGNGGIKNVEIWY